MNDSVMVPTGGPSDFNGGKWWQRLLEAISIGVVGFFRQSSLLQARRNLGSQQVQREQLKHLAPFGVLEEDVTVVLAFGESGRPGVVRERFQRLIRLVIAGKVGLVVLARHDRLGRDSEAARELFHHMKARGVLIMVDGRFYDPSDPHDAFVLEIHALVAELENRARARWVALSTFAKARAYGARIPLPTGLVWADPEDPAYRDALERAGLLHWVADMSRHKEMSRVEQEPPGGEHPGDSGAEVSRGPHYPSRQLYVLPYPDAEVEQAVRLSIRWLLDTRSLTALLARIHAGHPGWPRKGLMPLRVGGSTFGRGGGVRWVPAERTRMYDFLQSPALYGIYRYDARSLRPVLRREPRVIEPRPRR